MGAARTGQRGCRTAAFAGHVRVDRRGDLDWLDADGDPRPGGAEAEYYASQGLPYEPRNGVPALLEELLLVRDVSRQACSARTRTPVFAWTPAHPRTASLASAVGREDELPWGRLLTVYSAERNITYDGNPGSTLTIAI